MVPVVV